jgi:hypothetical protein
MSLVTLQKIKIDRTSSLIINPKSLNNKKIDNLKSKGYHYFKDQISNGKREICFSKKKYNKDG